jgi:plasmid stabilization system protein ParE
VSGARQIRVSVQAQRQIREADVWWRANRDKAPNALREEIERMEQLLAFRPYVGARATNVKLVGVRKVHIERIHYDVYYRVVGTPEYIEIVAFWSSRRGSGPPL